MKKTAILLLASLLLVGAGCSASKTTSVSTGGTVNINGVSDSAPAVALATDCKNLIKTADIENISGIKPIVDIAHDTNIGADGDCNFGNDPKNMVLLVNVDDPSFYQPSYDAFKSSLKDVSGIGDAAFSVMDYNLTVKTSKATISVASFFSTENGKTYLSMDQLKQVVNLIISRM